MAHTTAMEINGGSPSGAITLAEVAKELHCSKAHVSNIVRGRVSSVPPLPVVRLGRRVLVRRASFVEWMSSLEASATIDADLNSPLVTHGKEDHA